MSMRLLHRAYLVCIGACISGCAVAPPRSTALAPTSHAPAGTRTLLAATARNEPPPAPVPPTDQPLVRAPPTLPTGWSYASWHGLQVPLPAHATGVTSSTSTTATYLHGFAVLADGILTFPPVSTPMDGAVGEYPAPPRLTIVQFAGTLDDWIALESQTGDGTQRGVMNPVEQRTIAGRDARHYQRTVPGFNYNDYYVLKPTATTLLLIYTSAEVYGPLVDSLVLETP